jgi:2'-5' RNA ligase
VLRGPASALIVPVEAANDTRHPSARERGMPAHVTILYPFAPTRRLDAQARGRLAAAIGEVRAFDFTLRELRRFPTVVYLAPEPAAPFIALAEAVMREWPQYKPYGGAFATVVPHLTVAYGDTAPTVVHERVPIEARADEVWLMTRMLIRWVRRRRFTLGPHG